MTSALTSGGKCGYESGDLVTLKDEAGWHGKRSSEEKQSDQVLPKMH